jgi:hypothetical protein
MYGVSQGVAQTKVVITEFNCITNPYAGLATYALLLRSMTA